MNRLTLALIALLMTLPNAAASPSTFPETSASFHLGYGQGITAAVSAEVMMPVQYLDLSAGLSLSAPLATIKGDWHARLTGSALVFPALATTPPLALGLGTDIGVGGDGFSAHAGPMIGSDLLFSFDLPMTVSAYLGAGYHSGRGFSLAWSAHIRYYFDDDDIALELLSSDRVPIGLGVRFLF